MTLSVSRVNHIAYVRVLERYVNEDFEEIWKEVILIQLRYYTRICLQEKRTTTKTLTTIACVHAKTKTRLIPDYKHRNLSLLQPARLK